MLKLKKIFSGHFRIPNSEFRKWKRHSPFQQIIIIIDKNRCSTCVALVLLYFSHAKSAGGRTNQTFHARSKCSLWLVSSEPLMLIHNAICLLTEQLIIRNRNSWTYDFESIDDKCLCIVCWMLNISMLTDRMQWAQSNDLFSWGKGSMSFPKIPNILLLVSFS